MAAHSRQATEKHAQNRKEIAKAWHEKQEWDWRANILDTSVTALLTSRNTPSDLAEVLLVYTGFMTIICSLLS